MTEIKNRPASLFPFIFGDNIGFYFAGSGDDMGQRLCIPIENKREILIYILK
jgi:hypothetical protein